MTATAGRCDTSWPDRRLPAIGGPRRAVGGGDRVPDPHLDPRDAVGAGAATLSSTVPARRRPSRASHGRPSWSMSTAGRIDTTPCCATSSGRSCWPASPRPLPRLHRRAADWYQANGDLDRAVDHAFAAGDLDLAAALAGRGMLRYHWSGRRATTRAWFARFGDEALEERPWLAVLAAWEELAAGDVAAAMRLADIVERSTYDGPAAGRHGLVRVLRERCCGRQWFAGARPTHSRTQPGRWRWRWLAVLARPCAVGARRRPPHDRRPGRDRRGTRPRRSRLRARPATQGSATASWAIGPCCTPRRATGPPPRHFSRKPRRSVSPRTWRLSLRRPVSRRADQDRHPPGRHRCRPQEPRPGGEPPARDDGGGARPLARVPPRPRPRPSRHRRPRRRPDAPAQAGQVIRQRPDLGVLPGEVPRAARADRHAGALARAAAHPRSQRRSCGCWPCCPTTCRSRRSGSGSASGEAPSRRHALAIYGKLGRLDAQRGHRPARSRPGSSSPSCPGRPPPPSGRMRLASGG